MATNKFFKHAVKSEQGLIEDLDVAERGWDSSEVIIPAGTAIIP